MNEPAGFAVYIRLGSEEHIRGTMHRQKFGVNRIAKNAAPSLEFGHCLTRKLARQIVSLLEPQLHMQIKICKRGDTNPMTEHAVPSAGQFKLAG